MTLGQGGDQLGRQLPLIPADLTAVEMVEMHERLTVPGGLSGAELAVGPGWIGLRSHPRVSTSIVLDGPGVPDWLDGVLREATTGLAGGS